MVRVAIIGAGTMGCVHGNAFSNVSGAKVAAVCDLDPRKAEALAGRLGARPYGSIEEMLGAESVDAADICLPTYLHKDAALLAIGKGLQVFCEKPIALDAAEARAMAAAAEARGVRLGVGQVVRYFPAYATAARTAAARKIGTPKLIRTTRTGSYPAVGWDGWYGDRARSGGIILDLVIHDFDWIRSSFGEVERVYAKSLGKRGGRDMDHCLVLLRLENGAIAHVEGSWAYPKGTIFGSSFEIVGTAGQIEYDSRAASPIRKDIARDPYPGYTLESPLSPDEEPYVAELQDFVDALREGREAPVPAGEAIKAVEIARAAIESAEKGVAVSIGRSAR